MRSFSFVNLLLAAVHQPGVPLPEEGAGEGGLGIVCVREGGGGRASESHLGECPCDDEAFMANIFSSANRRCSASMISIRSASRLLLSLAFSASASSSASVGR